MRRFRRPFVTAGARQPGGFVVDLRRERFHLVIRHSDRGGVEGIGFQNIRARFQISVVDLADHLGLAEHQKIVVAFKIAGPVAETTAAKIVLVQFITLDHGAHAAIQHHDALRELLMQRFDSVAHSCLIQLSLLAKIPARHTGITFIREEAATNTRLGRKNFCERSCYQITPA